MKTKAILISLIGVLAITTTVFQACKKTEENINQPPTSGTFTDPRDGQTYETREIGPFYPPGETQTWFAENLNYNTGDGNNNSWCYGGWPECCDIYGRLYTWEAATSACPDGWHLPSDDEWTTLIDFLGGEDVAGGKLKSETGWFLNGNGTNSVLFTALPGGWRSDDPPWNTFAEKGRKGFWWSATEYSSQYFATRAWYRGMYYGNGIVGRNDGNKEFGFSVRCVKD